MQQSTTRPVPIGHLSRQCHCKVGIDDAWPGGREVDCDECDDRESYVPEHDPAVGIASSQMRSDGSVTYDFHDQYSCKMLHAKTLEYYGRGNNSTVKLLTRTLLK
jgi:hypothetical protein